MNREPRLRSIFLRDFKSVGEQDVTLGPLTAVVGANSAGKSTLLQAILTLAQAVRSESDTPDFPLNGPLIRLGTFEETLNYLSADSVNSFEVRFDVTDHSRLARQMRLPFEDDALELLDDWDRERLRERVVSWHAFVEPVDADGAAGERGFAQIARLRLSVSSSMDGDADASAAYECDLSPAAGDSAFAAEIQGLRAVGGGPRPGVRIRPIPVDGRVQDLVTGAPPRIHAVALYGGVPHGFFERTTRLEHLADLWWRTANAALEDVPDGSDQLDALITDDEDVANRGELIARAQNHAAEHIRSLLDGDDEPELPVSLRRRRLMWAAERFFFAQLTRLVNQFDPSDLLAFRQSLALQGEATFRTALREKLDDLDELYEPVLLEHSGPAVEMLTRSGRIAQRFLSSDIRYLGPLREAPNVLYDPGPGQTDIGPKGEYAAAVLHAQARSLVDMPEIPGQPPFVSRLPLNEALNAWLAWFGLANEATAEDRGRLGIGLSVTPAALGRPVDLTSVGVGVSQVFPVVLVCLLARPGTLVVLEQPELHLHPKLQQDLADFFLACVESGRQIVLETHSEHLVNRLRRRVAGDESDVTRDLVKLIFAENTDGITTYRESQVNPYGGLDDDWPDGFLDVGARESSALIKESAAKRRRAIADDAD